MNLYQRRPNQSARCKLKELSNGYGHELYIVRALLDRVSDEVCEQLLSDLHEGKLFQTNTRSHEQPDLNYVR